MHLPTNIFTYYYKHMSGLMTHTHIHTLMQAYGPCYDFLTRIKLFHSAARGFPLFDINWLQHLISVFIVCPVLYWFYRCRTIHLGCWWNVKRISPLSRWKVLSFSIILLHSTFHSVLFVSCAFKNQLHWNCCFVSISSASGLQQGDFAPLSYSIQMNESRSCMPCIFHSPHLG